MFTGWTVSYLLLIFTVLNVGSAAEQGSVKNDEKEITHENIENDESWLSTRELRADKDDKFWAIRGKRAGEEADFWATRGKKQVIKPNGLFQAMQLEDKMKRGLKPNGLFGSMKRSMKPNSLFSAYKKIFLWFEAKWFVRSLQ